MGNTELKFSLHVIEKELETYNPVSIIHEPMELDIFKIRMFNPDLKNLCKRTIYIAPYKILSTIKNLEERIHIICPDRESPEIPSDINFDLICLDGSIDSEFLFSALQGIFEKYYYWQQRMIDLIVSGGSMQKLIGIAGEMLLNPIALFDTTLKLVDDTGLSSFNYEGTIWEQLIPHGTSIIEEFSTDQKRTFHKDLSHKEKPFIFPYKGYDLLITTLFLDNNRIGNLISVNSVKPFYNDQISLLINIKGVIEVFYNNKKKLLFNPITDSIIEKMLKGKYVEEKLIENHLKSMSLRMNDSFIVIVFDNAVKDFPDSYKTYCYHINNFFKKALTILFGEHIVTAVKIDSYSYSELLSNNSLKKFLEESGIRCGISMYFNNFLI